MAVDSTPARPPAAGFFPLALTAAGCHSRRSTAKSATGYDWRRCGSGWGVTTSPPGSVQCRSNKVELRRFPAVRDSWGKGSRTIRRPCPFPFHGVGATHIDEPATPGEHFKRDGFTFREYHPWTA